MLRRGLRGFGGAGKRRPGAGRAPPAPNRRAPGTKEPPKRMDYLLALAADPNAWAALVTLTAMEVVLGIDKPVSSIDP